MNLNMQERAVCSLSGIRDRAEAFLPGGTSATSRINPYTGHPLYLRKAEGCRVWDASGKEYIDFFMGHGAILLGHNEPGIRSALNTAMNHGFVAEYDHELNIELAEKITGCVPCAGKVRFQNSGSESTLLAMRLARGYTGKDIILRFDGQFHGFQDYAMNNNIAARIDRANPGNRISEINHLAGGVPSVIDQTIIVIPWNNEEILNSVIREKGDKIAGIITNPIDFNNGCLKTSSEYLANMKRLASDNDIVVVFDEILTGFKTGLDCGQGYMGVTPDLCTLGKCLSNGVPTSVVAGKKEIMDIIVRSEHPVAASGTFSGNLLGTSASLASLERMSEEGFYPDLISKTEYFTSSLQEMIDRKDLACRVQSAGCMFGIYWGMTDEVNSCGQVNQVDRERASQFFTQCIDAGLYFQTDMIISAAHKQNDLDEALGKIEQILARM